MEWAHRDSGNQVRLFQGGGGTTRCRPTEAGQGVSKMIAMAFLETSAGGREARLWGEEELRGYEGVS